MKTLLRLGIAAAALLTASFRAPEPPPFHCQVPCGIYGDKLRVDLLMEDASTVEKAMMSIVELSAAESPNYNQLVRWVTTKEEHAQKIQDQVAAYWLAQRVKAPQDGADAAAREKYLTQLELMHGITVAAMKCKQTTDPANVVKVRGLALRFSETYFSAEDLEHMRADHKGGH